MSFEEITKKSVEVNIFSTWIENSNFTFDTFSLDGTNIGQYHVTKVKSFTGGKSGDRKNKRKIKRIIVCDGRSEKEKNFRRDSRHVITPSRLILFYSKNSIFSHFYRTFFI